MPRVPASSSEQELTPKCSGCQKQNGTLQCIECIRDGGGSAVFCASGCFKVHWQQHRNSLLRQSSSPGQSIKTGARPDAPVVNMKTGGGQRSYSGHVLLPASKERMVFRADTAAFQPRAVYATGAAHQR